MKRILFYLSVCLSVLVSSTVSEAVPIDPIPEPNFTSKPKPKQERTQKPKPKQERKQKAEQTSKPKPKPDSRKLDGNGTPGKQEAASRVNQKTEAAFTRYGHADYRHLDLITQTDNGTYRYFTEGEWNEVPSTAKNSYKKLGVVVVSGGCTPFYVELHDSDRYMKWYEGNRLYGNRLPSEAQCNAMAKNYTDINSRIIHFGGDSDPKFWYWGQSKDSSNAWVVGMNGGGVISYNKTGAYTIRAVAPVPESSASEAHPDFILF